MTDVEVELQIASLLGMTWVGTGKISSSHKWATDTMRNNTRNTLQAVGGFDRIRALELLQVYKFEILAENSESQGIISGP